MRTRGYTCPVDREIDAPAGHAPAAPEDPTTIEPAPSIPEVAEDRDPTMVLPVPPAVPDGDAADHRHPGRAYAVIAGVIALLLMVSLVGSGPESPVEAEDTSVTVPTTLTTDPPTTTTAAAEPAERPEGKGKGKGRKDDD